MDAAILQTQAADAEPASGPVALRLDEGTELLGVYDGSAFKEPQYLLRRGDGQVIQVSRLLYLVASSIDGERDVAQVAASVSELLGRHVTAENISYLVENKLQPLGVLSGDEHPTTLVRVNPLLTLRLRARVVPERLHRGATWVLRPLFWPAVVLGFVAAFVALDAWLFAVRGADFLHGTQELILHPDLLLLVTVLTVAAAAFHEIGHATAARYGGAKAGVMGVGVYLMMPVFYTDVTDSYRLNRRGRLRTDLGGIYFNLIAIVIAGGVYWVTAFRPLLIFILFSQLEVLYQFLPFVRMDGYYVVSDLVGVPNLFAFVGPVVASLLRRGRGVANDRLGRITPRARAAIRVWVALTIPILAVNVAVFLIFAPRVVPAMWTSAHVQARAMANALAAGQVVTGLNRLTQLVLLTIPGAGMAYIVILLLGRVTRAVAGWWPTRPLAAAALALAVIGGMAFEGSQIHLPLTTSVRPQTSVIAAPAAPARSPAPASPAQPRPMSSTAQVAGCQPGPGPDGQVSSAQRQSWMQELQCDAPLVASSSYRGTG